MLIPASRSPRLRSHVPALHRGRRRESPTRALLGDAVIARDVLIRHALPTDCPDLERLPATCRLALEAISQQGMATRVEPKRPLPAPRPDVSGPSSRTARRASISRSARASCVRCPVFLLARRLRGDATRPS